MKTKKSVFYFSVSFALVSFLLFSNCTNVDDLTFSEELNGVEEVVFDEFERLSFLNEDDLSYAILNEDAELRASNSFISLMNKIPDSDLRSNSEEDITYYEALGFDTLIPNPNFARLINPSGELVVGNDIIKITPNGTYQISLDKLQQFNALYAQDSTLTGTFIGEDKYQIQEGIFLYKTFEQDDNYVFEEADSYSEEQENLLRSTAMPSIDSFDTFSADRQTLAGKFIQNLFGTSREHVVSYGSTRRLKGTFYSYNYGVYAEIGVQGWTDKKNTIGWSKTQANEIRVGWSRVVIKLEVTDNYQRDMKAVRELAYYPPQYMVFDGQRMNVATLVMPDIDKSFEDELYAKGAKAAYDYIKEKKGASDSELDKAEAFIVASLTKLYFMSSTREVIKTNVKSYTHVFSNTIGSFEAGWNNKNGFFINGINQNNYTAPTAWGQTIVRTLNEQKATLVAGEVYVCARLDSNWRGMRIVKKEKQK